MFHESAALLSLWRAGRGIALSGGLLLIGAGASPAWAQPAATNCPPGQAPQFVSGFAALKLRLGTRMGDPMDCQHTDANGDTVQHTTTGLAYDPNGTGGAAAFTNGWEHYALKDDQVVLWRNASVNPPQPTADQAAYVQQTLPLRTRLDQLDQRLVGILQQARAGALDDVGQSVLGSTIEDLTSLGDELSSTPTPPDLVPYAQRWVQAQQGDLAAATALVQARLTQVPDERAANLADAATQLQARDEAREAASFALSQVLPVTYTPTI
jgi:hypothetical protein